MGLDLEWKVEENPSRISPESYPGTTVDMPLYEYECTQCHERTEKIQKFSDPEITVCPHCSGHLERVLSAPAITFKGGGWYADGYGNAKPKTESKSESKTEGSSTSSSSSTNGAGSTSSPAPSSTPAASAAK